MNRKEKLVLKDNHELLVQDLDTKEIRPFLFQHGAIDDETYLDNEPVREKRVEILLKHVKDNCSFETFVQSLKYNNSYVHLAEKPITDKGSVRNVTRAIQFRHQMKRCTLQHDYETFDSLYNQALMDWDSAPKHQLQVSKRQELADMYFMAIDAKIEQRRILFDKKLHESDLFDKLAIISTQTTNPTLPCIMQLARLGTAILMDGYSTENALSYILQAKQNIEEGLLPACRETGIVIYIEFNIELQINERMNTKFDKEKFALLGTRAIEHFGEEAETVGDDFKRILLTKMARVDLGMGLFLDFVEDVVDVHEDHLKRAESILKEIEKEEMWTRMELRAKMAYYAMKSRVSHIRKDTFTALQLLEESLKYGIIGNFKKEIESINRNISMLKELNL